MFIASHSMILFITKITTTKRAMNTNSLKLIPASPMTTKSHLQIKMTNKSISIYLSEPLQKNIWSSIKISAKISSHSFLSQIATSPLCLCVHCKVLFWQAQAKELLEFTPGQWSKNLLNYSSQERTKSE